MKPDKALCLAAVVLSLFTSQMPTNGQDTQQRSRILSLETSPVYVAEEALKENIQKKDVKAVCLSLQHQYYYIKLKAASALGTPGKNEAVGCLLQAFKEHQSYNPLYLNSELKGMRNEFDDLLIDSLAKLTGLRLSVKPRASEERLTEAQAKSIIQAVERWQKTQSRKTSSNPGKRN